MNNNLLTPDEIAFLNKLQEQKNKHKVAQQRYRDKSKSNNPDYNKDHNQYQKQYYNKIRNKENEIKNKFLDNTPKTLNIQEFNNQPPKIDKRTRRGKKQTIQSQNIIPSHLTRKEPLGLSTIDDYIRKTNIINKLFNKKPLSTNIKNELKKLFNDNAFNQDIVLNEMKYINNDNIEPIIQTLRAHYTNDNSFKSYINILTVITSHLNGFNDAYQILSKINIKTNKDIQDVRGDNVVDELDKGKIIDLDKDIILKNIDKLDNINDKLIFGLYTLFPARRLEWRNVKITTETDVNKLNNDDTNFLIISVNPFKVIFNDYKTSTTYGQQVFNIPNELSSIISKYININKLSDGDYLFYLSRDKREIISEPNFSKKVSNVFYKVYNIPISIRFLRMSWSVWINTQKFSVNTKKEYINKLAHSYEENQRYFKIL